ncbi:D-glycero-beta-D-manno-heptose 1-phosphate adenylyltransferase [Planomonospora parontospora]|uniref:D-glycero-beta-D-manno-heptose 1-phosphate adenylyltransferase n=1 Tax=Planomonospora parontospora TaxID=58119 RepID=UPI001670C22E|nr:D-glycero-beta-D-manno-heptose 1-phosphate adenylyltransferase [Planomonospora parontospora]GGL51053.1 bifunctional protein HldE [Planomonospora parontospora subsp. antibiotica]GII19024.1 bifunctional protein HldE [Planomonospora parontospora subsp. antibiotica]
MRPGPLVVVGDTLLDVDVEGEAERLCPDAPVPVVAAGRRDRRPGGAGLAALLAARAGAEVVLVTALGDDEPGRWLREALSGLMEVVGLPLRGGTVTKTRIRARGQTLLRLDTGEGRAHVPGFGAGEGQAHPFRFGGGEGRAHPGPRGGRLADAARDRPAALNARRAAAALRGAGAVLVSDYGLGTAEALREATTLTSAPVVWDPHPRGPVPAPGCALITPNEAEARLLCAPEPYTSPEQAARHLARAFAAEAVAVTLGARGAAVARRGGAVVRVPSPPVAAGTDACGAGDRFAGAAALALRDGARAEDAVAAASREAGGFVEGGGAAAVRLPDPEPGGRLPGLGDRPRTPLEVARVVRAAGCRLVATGGCFDLLHAGHVSLLRRARALGDALIVCVNSDDSVRRLKGAGRPVVGEEDRTEVLRALECVDAVAVFDESTPAALIERLRPDVWVKGGDYAESDLPEAEVVHRAGGEIVILPLVPGQSTTNLIAAARAAL